MRKLFIIVTIVFCCICGYFGFKFLLDYFNDMRIFMNDSYSTSSSSGTFAFKRTPENLELVNSYLKVNNDFIKDMSKDVILEKDIKSIEGLISGFPSFKNYYSARLKLEKAVFEGFPYLIDNAVNLSDKELEKFLNNNLEYLDKTFGVTSLEQLSNITTNLSYILNKEINYAEIPENSAVYNPYGQSTVFRVKVGYDSNDFVYFSINAYHGYDTDNQKAPVIVFNALGGMS